MRKLFNWDSVGISKANKTHSLFFNLMVYFDSYYCFCCCWITLWYTLLVIILLQLFVCSWISLSAYFFRNSVTFVFPSSTLCYVARVINVVTIIIVNINITVFFYLRLFLVYCDCGAVGRCCLKRFFCPSAERRLSEMISHAVGKEAHSIRGKVPYESARRAFPLSSLWLSQVGFLPLKCLQKANEGALRPPTDLLNNNHHNYANNKNTNHSSIIVNV